VYLGQWPALADAAQKREALLDQHCACRALDNEDKVDVAIADLSGLPVCLRLRRADQRSKARVAGDVARDVVRSQLMESAGRQPATCLSSLWDGDPMPVEERTDVKRVTSLGDEAFLGDDSCM
jgi:hypothetical protein